MTVMLCDTTTGIWHIWLNSPPGPNNGDQAGCGHAKTGDDQPQANQQSSRCPACVTALQQRGQ